jgi:hypothetical protein
VLTDIVDAVRRRPLPVLVALALGALLGAGVALAFDRGGGEVQGVQPPSTRTVPPPVASRPPTPPAPRAETTVTFESRPAPAAASEQEFMAALDRGVTAAEEHGGEAEAAVWVEGWSKPVIVSLDQRRTRMWSMSKPATAIAALRAGEGRKPDPILLSAISDAIVRSSNCAQRRVVLGLQELEGRPGARAAFHEVFLDARADPVVTTQAATPEQICHDYLNQRRGGLADPLGTALLLGTSEWTVADAIRFAHALGLGKYGSAGEHVLKLMRSPKQRSPEARAADDYTAHLEWGAGVALAQWDPAYKGGWGGKLQGRYVAGQIVVLDVGDTSVAVAATFHPWQRVEDDDPGKTVAPRAIEAIFRELAKAFDKLERSA